MGDVAININNCSVTSVSSINTYPSSVPYAQVNVANNPVSLTDNSTPANTRGGPNTTLAIGGIAAGTTFTDVDYSTVFDMLLYPYQSPVFNSFSVSGLTDTEVGATFASGNRIYTWATSNSANVAPDSVNIIDATNSNSSLGSGLPNNGSALLMTPALTKVTAASHTFRIEATNTQSSVFSRTFSISWRWALHYGESDIEALSSTDITNLRIKELASTSAKTYNFQSGNYKYICHPTSFGIKTTFNDTSTNLDVAMLSPYVVSVVNIHGVSTNYYVHRTLNKLGGAINIQVSN